MKHQDVSDYDEDCEEGCEEGSRTIAETFAYKSGVESTSETPAKALVSIAETDCIASETSSETKECVFCRRKVCVVHSFSLLASQIKIVLEYFFNVEFL